MKQFLLSFCALAFLQTSFSQTLERAYSSYFGGSLAEDVFSIAVDDDGNIYIAGNTPSEDLPTTENGFQPVYGGGNRDAFIAKFTNYNQLAWCTYIGGDGRESIQKLVVSGNALYFCGNTESTNLPITDGCFQSEYGSNTDGMIGKMTLEGEMQWLTYYGGGGMDYLDALVIYEEHLYCVGHSWSSSHMTTKGVHQEALNGAGDGAIAIFDTSGNRLYGSYLGGDNLDYLYDIAIDNNGNVNVCGQTNSTSALATDGAFQETKGEGNDAFMAQFNSNMELQWCTYFGGDNDDNSNALITDNDNNIWIGGGTKSTNLVTSNNALMTTYQDEGEDDDCFILQLDTSGDELWTSYFGGSGFEGIGDMALMGNRVLIGGYSFATNLPTTENAYQSERSGFTDGFLLSLSPIDYSVDMCSYYGGSDNDFIRALFATNERLYLVGDSGSNNVMATEDAYKENPTGGYPDGFVSVFEIGTINIDENSSTEFSAMAVYPNPAINAVSIRSENAITSWEIFSVSGELILSEHNINRTVVQIPVTSLACGIYMLHGHSNSEHSVMKLVVQ